MTNFYKSGGSYYIAGTNTKIADPTALQALSKAGGKELTAINGAQYNTSESQKANFDNITQVGNTLYGMAKAKPITNASPSIPVVDSATLNNGTNSPTITLGSANEEAQKILNDNAIKSATDASNKYQAEADRIKAANLQQITADKETAEKSLTDLQNQKNTIITNYDASMKPSTDLARSEYERMLGSLEQINYDSLVKDRLNATNDIISYSKLMNDELTQEASRPALASVKQGRQQNTKDTYTSKIATSQAVLQAIDGNFTLAFDIMSKGANAINQTTSDRINFLNSVISIYGDQLTTAKNKLTALTEDEKTAIDQTIKDLETKQKNIEVNKAEIMKLMETNPIIAQKSGLLLTDTPEQRAQKLNDFYVKNPQYTPESQDFIKNAMEKYYDAGITMNDPIATVQSKIKNSPTYQNENSGKTKDYEGSTPSGDLFTPGTVGGQCGEYVHKIVDGVPTMGDLYTQKMSIANVSTNEWKIGDMLIQKTKMPYGHVSVVTGIDGNNVTVTESNWNNDEKVGTRVIQKGDKSVSGVYRGGTIKQQAQTPSTVSNTVLRWAENIRDNKAKLSDITSEVEKADPGLKSEVNALLATLPPSKAQINETQKLVDRLKELRNHPGLNSAVGPTKLSRMSWWDTFGNKDSFLGKADTIISKKALDSLISAKSQGASFGALSEKEMSILKSAGTTLGAWSNEEKDGKISGFDVSQSEFKKELDKMIKEYDDLLLEANGNQGSGVAPSGVTWTVGNGGQSTPSGVTYEVIN